MSRWVVKLANFLSNLRCKSEGFELRISPCETVKAGQPIIHARRNPKYSRADVVAIMKEGMVEMREKKNPMTSEQEKEFRASLDGAFRNAKVIYVDDDEIEQ